MLNHRSIRAKFTLLGAVILNILARAWRVLLRRPPTSQRWLEALDREEIEVTPPQLWSYAESTSRCVGCGLCDAVAAGDPVSEWIMSVGRRPEDALLPKTEVERLNEVGEAIARVCPVGLSPAAVVRLVRERAAQLEGER